MGSAHASLRCTPLAEYCGFACNLPPGINKLLSLNFINVDSYINAYFCIKKAFDLAICWPCRLSMGS